MTNGLMTTSDGRRTVSYLARCALPAGDSLVKQDHTGATYTFPGSIGLCPSWKTGGISGNNECREYVSACMMALINAAGVQVPITLDANHPAIGWGQNPSFPYQEGTYFGDLFQSGAHGIGGLNAYFCEGPDFVAGVVPGRIGTDQGPTPYKNKGACRSYCTASDQVTNGRPDGYKACTGWNATVTVYRQPSYVPAFISGYNYQLTNAAANTSVEIEAGTPRAKPKKTLTSAPTQLFKIVREGSFWKLVLKSDTSKCLDSYWGTSVNVAGCGGNNSSQQFEASADSRGRFTLANVANGKKVLAVNNGNLEFQARNGSDSQAWKLGAIDSP
jgi:hypothetical protein